MNILQFAKSFSRKVNVYPAPVPVLLSPENLAKLSKEDVEKTVQNWEDGWKRKNAEDKINFEYALARILNLYCLSTKV